jgi:hypothetical protein
MASIYDKSSLVLIPSGTKTGKVFSQKPVSGDGDFTFTRASAATRVNADGNIEKETGNLLTYSNTFSSGWGAIGSSVTSGQSGYDGTSDAWLLSKTAGSGRLFIGVSESGVNTYSVYVKADALNWVRIMTNGSNTRDMYFDLANGALGTSTYGGQIDATITSVGGGWYRCTISVNETITLVRIYPAQNDGFVGGTSGSIYIQDAQLEQGLVARDYIETTTAAVYGGITDNTPRLDYTDSSCPALLLEPQRTNLASQSEAFVDSSYWTTTNLDIVANDTTSPEGVDNASFLRPTTTNGGHQMYKTFSMSAGTNTLSVFLKAGNYSKFRLYFYDGSSAHEVYGDCSDGSIHSTNSTTSVEDYGNGWYRYSVTATNNSFGAGNFTIRVVSDSYQDVWAANGTDGLYIYGWQFENGSYATSYIPTYGSSVTRVDDSCVKTGVSNLIGQTEGTLFMDVDLYARDSYSYFALAPNLGSTSVYIGIGITATAFSFEVVNSGVQVAYNYSNSSTGNFKLAFAYKANDFVAYVNGTQVMTDTSGSVPACSQIALHQYDKDQPFLYKQALVFKTRLTNAELADLTTL